MESNAVKIKKKGEKMNLTGQFTRTVYQLIVRAGYAVIKEEENYVELETTTRYLYEVNELPNGGFLETCERYDCNLVVYDDGLYEVRRGSLSLYDAEVLEDCGYKEKQKEEAK